jgi:hypothetical protein
MAERRCDSDAIHAGSDSLPPFHFPFAAPPAVKSLFVLAFIRVHSRTDSEFLRGQ